MYGPKSNHNLVGHWAFPGCKFLGSLSGVVYSELLSLYCQPVSKYIIAFPDPSDLIIGQCSWEEYVVTFIVRLKGNLVFQQRGFSIISLSWVGQPCQYEPFNGTFALQKTVKHECNKGVSIVEPSFITDFVNFLKLQKGFMWRWTLIAVKKDS